MYLYTLTQAAIWLLILGGLLIASAHANLGQYSGTSEQVMQTRPHAAGSPSALLAEHDCWTGGEGHPVPAHVVVTRDGDVTPTYGGRRLVGLALDQVFNGVDHDVTVHGFCR